MKVTTYNVIGFRSMKMNGMFKHLMYAHIVRAPFETITVTEREDGTIVNLESAEFVRYSAHEKYGCRTIMLKFDNQEYLFYTDSPITHENLPETTFSQSCFDWSKEQIRKAMQRTIEETNKAWYIS